MGAHLELGEVARGGKVDVKTEEKDPLNDIEEGEVLGNRNYFKSYRSKSNKGVEYENKKDVLADKVTLKTFDIKAKGLYAEQKNHKMLVAAQKCSHCDYATKNRS